MMDRGENCIALMVRYPRPGQVKTRLAREVGEITAWELYRFFVRDMIEVLDASGLKYIIAHTPDGDGKSMLDWLGPGRELMAQTGDGLGQRLKGVFMRCFESGHDRSIALGSDTPDLEPGILRQAMDSLESHDVVLGPCSDGGYYLIGFRRDTFVPTVFDDMPWSTPEVMAETLDRLDPMDMDVHLLPEWSDIDTLHDLKHFMRRKSSWGNRTREYLSNQDFGEYSDDRDEKTPPNQLAADHVTCRRP